VRGERGEGEAGRLAAGAGLAQRKEGARDREKLGQADFKGEGNFLFFYSKAIFKSIFLNCLKRVCTLVKSTHLNKSNAKACMLKHIANSYGNF